MAELYLFDQNDKFINILTEDEGLVDTWFKDYQNHVEDEFFVFNIDSNSELLVHIIEENQVAFYDRDRRLRLARMKDLSEITTSDSGAISHEIRVKCEPSFLELHDHFIEDRRITEGTAQTALNRALEGSRHIGEVTVDLGLATDNFYWIDGIEAVFKILKTWGGALKDTITLNEDNEIIERKLWIVQRLGTDNGLIVEPDYNAETVSRNTLSYPETALWGQGSSLEIEDDEGELTGGHTRYITFEDVEWKVSKGDPVDKPKGQKWVGDPDALARDGYLDNGTRKHRFGHFSNQDYEDPEELLWATWQELQERKLKEIMHEATIYESDKKVSLGDTVTILNREYNKPIELQSQTTGLEYDVLYPDDEIKIVVGKYIDMNEDPLQKEVDDLKEDIRKPRPTKPIDNGSFPDIEPGTPVNVSATGAFQTIQLFWDYDSNVYISHYEVYGSQLSDFVPDEQQLLYRGRVSAFSHEVPTDEMWYYYVRAVNTRGTAGEFSNRVSASSVRIINDDILFGSITAEHLTNNLDIADKLAQNTIDRINEGPMKAIEYTQEEIEDAENRILGKLNNEIGDVNTAITDLLDRTSDVEGTVTNIKTDIDTINGEISATIDELTNLDDVVRQQTLDIKANAEGLSAKAEKSKVYTRTATDSLLGDKVNVTTYENKMSQLDINVSGISGRVSNTETNINDLTGDMSSALSQIGELDVKANNINASVSEVRADLDGLEIGGRNLLPSFNSSRWNITQTAEVYDYELVFPEGTNPQVRIVIDVEKNTNYTMTFNSDHARYYIFEMINGEQGKRLRTITEGSDIFTFKTEDFNQISLLINSYSQRVDLTRNIWKPKLEKGNKATDWSPAPEDIDANFSDMRASLDLKADSATLEVVSKRVNQDSNLLEDARASINVLRSDIKLKVDVDGVIASINLSKEGVRIDGNKHHITGQTLIDDAVIGTSAIANLAVDRFHLKYGIIDNVHIEDATIEHTKMKSLNVDQVVAGQMSLNYLKAGTIDTNKFTVRGGSAIDYAKIEGSFMELRGRYNRTWRGSTTNHDVRTRLQNGHLRFRNDVLKRSLYMSEFGISTYIDGDGEAEESNGSSGTILWWDTEYSPTGQRGITVNSWGGTASLISDRHHALIRSHYSADVESKASYVQIHPFQSESSSNFFFTKSADRGEGYLVYGYTDKSGLRFRRGGGGRIEVVDKNYNTGGNTTIEAGVGLYNRIDRRSGNSYVHIVGTDFLGVGTDNIGTRVYSQGSYRRTYSYGANVYITSNGTFGRATSASKYKLSIEPQFNKVIEQLNHSKSILNLDIKSWFDKTESETLAKECELGKRCSDDDFSLNRHYGLIAEDVERVGLKEHVSYGQNGAIEGIAYDRLWIHLIPIVDNHEHTINTHITDIKAIKTKQQKFEDKLNENNLEIQYLKQKIKKLEGAA